MAAESADHTSQVDPIPLSKRVRPGSEAALWVVNEIKALERKYEDAQYWRHRWFLEDQGHSKQVAEFWEKWKAAEAQVNEWTTADSPGGWIDQLRASLSAELQKSLQLAQKVDSLEDNLNTLEQALRDEHAQHQKSLLDRISELENERNELVVNIATWKERYYSERDRGDAWLTDCKKANERNEELEQDMERLEEWVTENSYIEDGIWKLGKLPLDPLNPTFRGSIDQIKRITK